MTDDDFWSLITTIDHLKLEDESSDDSVVKPLVAKLAQLQQIELESFQDHLTYFLYQLDGKKFAAACTKRGWSDDGFLYARAYVVAKGKEFYDRVIADPELMPKEYEECEHLLYAAQYAWSSENPEDWAYESSLSYETGSNELGWAE